MTLPSAVALQQRSGPSRWQPAQPVLTCTSAEAAGGVKRSPTGPSAASCEAVLLTPTDAVATRRIGSGTLRNAQRPVEPLGMPPIIDEESGPERAPAGPGWLVGGVIVLIAGGSAVGASGVSNTAAYLTFAAAITVALITWYATDRRQAAALEAEERRQAAALNAEERRLAQQLAHDKELSDRAALRDFLDEIAGAYEELHLDYSRLSVGFQKAQDASLTDDQRQRFSDMAVDAEHKVTDGLLEVSRLTRRLALRYPTGHPIVQAISEGLGEITEGLEELDAVHRDRVERSAAMATHAQGSLSAFERFANAVRQAFGAPEPS